MDIIPRLRRIISFFIVLNFSFLILIAIITRLNYLNKFTNLNVYYLNEKKIHSNNIYIWSKASIGDYFWHHIFEASITRNINNGYYKYGKFNKYNLKFFFRSGYSLTPNLLNQFLKKKFKIHKYVNLILILNGRTKENVAISRFYLNELNTFKKKNLNLGIIMLGNENCLNDWIIEYLERNGGLIKFLFVVYDWKMIDNRDIFQWPLGVATYRNFPFVDTTSLLFKTNRPFLCNYFGTTYNRTSREELQNLLNNKYFHNKCITTVRSEWLPNETNDTLQNYINALRLSDVTLSPVGKNHECYRIYEAMSFASLPIIEENLNHITRENSDCDQISAFRLLKEFKAPVEFISNWTTDLNETLIKISKLSEDDIIFKRISLIAWYEKFKRTIQTRFIHVLKNKFS